MRPRVWLGTEGGNERVILLTAGRPLFAYLAVRVLGRYYRLAVTVFLHGRVPVRLRVHASRS
jgi:hypothetical protein